MVIFPTSTDYPGREP